MADQISALAGLVAAVAPLAAGFAVRARSRRRQTVAVAGARAPDHQYHLPPTIEAAEREMAVLLRRMRAYLRDPYDYTASRIPDEAAFEACLDLAGTLGSRIAELGGAAPASQAEHERMRGLILESVMISAGSSSPGSSVTRRR